MNAPRNQRNGDRYERHPRFVNWSDRPSSSPAAQNAARETAMTVGRLNEWLDEHQAQGVIAEATAACAAEVRRQAAKAAGWEQGWPGE